MNYKLNRIEGTDTFFLAKEGVELLGENLITGTFNEVLSLANTLKTNAIDLGSGDLHKVAPIELSNILDVKWYLLVLSDRYQITRTSGTEIYNLPTNFLSAFEGSLDAVFQEIINLENG